MSPLAIALILESIALVAVLGLWMFRSSGGTTARTSSPSTPSSTRPSVRTDADADTARRTRDAARELSEAKAQISDLREQLRKVKRDRFDQKQSHHGGDVLVKERAHVEREASEQLETVRGELATALSDVIRLKAQLDLQPGRRRTPQTTTPEVHPEPAPPVQAPAEAPRVREPRELNASEKARLDRAEQRAASDRTKTSKLEEDLKRVRAKAELSGRLYAVVKGEGELARDKFKALEKRLNRTLLEKDLLTRALHQLERESGKVAPRTELTAEEAAASDARTDAAQRAEAAALETPPASPAAPSQPEPPLPSARVEPPLSMEAMATK